MNRRAAAVGLLILAVLLMPISAARNATPPGAEEAREKRQKVLQGEKPVWPGPPVARQMFDAVFNAIQGTAHTIGVSIAMLFGSAHDREDSEDASN